MPKTLIAALLLVAGTAYAGPQSITVFHDPSCGCCIGWVDHMREAGFQVKTVPTSAMVQVKEKLGVPQELDSCHTAVVDSTGQMIEGHVPATAVNKMLDNPSIKGVAAPGMPLNSPGMGPMDGNLVTVDFSGQPFSRD